MGSVGSRYLHEKIESEGVDSRFIFTLPSHSQTLQERVNCWNDNPKYFIHKSSICR